MNQWNRLKVKVIKTRRIECRKLDLPVLLTESHISPTNKKKSKSGSNSSSNQASSLESSRGDKQQNASRSSVTDNTTAEESSFEIEAESSFNSLITDEDEVFTKSFETPTSESFVEREASRRCLSLPERLYSDTKVGNEFFVYRQSRSLFKEALNLETSQGDHGGESLWTEIASEAGEGLWTRFPRDEEIRTCQEAMDNEMNPSRTPHAVTTNSPDIIETPNLITDHNNNNSSSEDKHVIHNSRQQRRSRSSLELRRDWEQKILDYTSESVFGAERAGVPQERVRPRSVTLTGSVFSLVKARDTEKNHDSETRTKSEGKQGMPKLHNTVWGYIKRRSSKRKGKNSKNSPKNDSEAVDSGYMTTGDLPQDQQGSECLKRNTFELANDVPLHRHKACKTTNSTRKQSTFPEGSDRVTEKRHFCLTKSKSTTNLERCAVTGFPERVPRRSNSWDDLQSIKDRPELSLSDFKENPDILKLLLTTDPERRPMEERLKTLTLSREWLLKELKELREDDRRLARQFINLRSTILEIRKAREKEESDCESEGEGCKSKLIDSQRMGARNTRNINQHGYQMNVSPTHNMLGYC